MQFQLRNENIFLRRYRVKDITERYRAIEDSRADISRWFSWCHPNYSEADNELWIRDCDQKWENGIEYSFRISNLQDTMQIGECRINHINEIHKMANISFWVRHGHEGKGIATQATLLIAKFGFQQLGLNRLEIFMSLRNYGSQRVAEKVGAVREGVLRNRINLRGAVEDAVLYSLIPRDL